MKAGRRTDPISQSNNPNRDLNLTFFSSPSVGPKGAAKRNAALISMARDSSISVLIPYFTQYIADEVTRNIRNLDLLYNLLELMKAMLTNEQIDLQLYVSALSCNQTSK